MLPQSGYERLLQDSYWNPGDDCGHPQAFTPSFRIDKFMYGTHAESVAPNEFRTWQRYGFAGGSLDDYVEFMMRTIRSRVAAGAVALKCAEAYNRTVAFESISRSAWLIDDPEPHAVRRRYLLLDDGDAWCETVHGAQPVGSGLENSYRWLTAPTPALGYVLDCSIDDARVGGDGFLIPVLDAAAVYAVSDRRARPRR